MKQFLTLRFGVIHSWQVAKLLEMPGSNHSITSVVSRAANCEDSWLPRIFSDVRLIVVEGALSDGQSRKLHQLVNRKNYSQSDSSDRYRGLEHFLSSETILELYPLIFSLIYFPGSGLLCDILVPR